MADFARNDRARFVADRSFCALDAMPSERTKAQSLALPALLLAVLLAGAGLRFHDLGAKSLWLDETQALFYVDRPLGETLAAVRAHDAHPPLYYALLHLWMGGSQDAARARAFSAFVSVLTLAVFYDLARRLLSQRGALVATLLLAVSAFQVYFAQEARHYALATFFVTLAWWLLVRLLTRAQGRAWPLWLGLALTNAAALYTFYYTAFAIVAQAVLLLVCWRDRGRRLLKRWAAWQLVPAALFALYVPVILERAQLLHDVAPASAGGVLSGPGLSATLAQFAAGFLGRLMGVFLVQQVAMLALPGLFVVLVGLAVLGEERGSLPGKLGLVWLLAPVGCLAVFPLRGHLYEPKHLAFAAPALALLAGAGMASSRRWLSFLAGCIVIVLLGSNAASVGLYFDRATQKENWRGLVAVMANAAKHGDAVVFNPHYTRLPFQYYYKALGRQRPLPRLVPVDAPLAGRPFRLDARLQGRRVWVVEAASSVAIPNPAVPQALRPYLLVAESTDIGLVGRISVRLYDTSRPAAETQSAPVRSSP